MTSLRTLLAAGLVSATAAIALPAVVSAATPPEPTAPATSDSPAGGAPLRRLEAACARLPKVEGRVDAAITLLQGDATTRGSIAWLDGQLARAQEHDRAELATVIQNRIDVRTARLNLLQERSAALTDIASICDAHGFGG